MERATWSTWLRLISQLSILHKGLRPDGKGLHSAFEIDLHYHGKPSSHTLSWLQNEHMLSSHSSFIMLVLNFFAIVASEVILCNWMSRCGVKLKVWHLFYITNNNFIFRFFRNYEKYILKCIFRWFPVNFKKSCHMHSYWEKKYSEVSVSHACLYKWRGGALPCLPFWYVLFLVIWFLGIWRPAENSFSLP